MSEFNQSAYVADYLKKNIRRVVVNLNRQTEKDMLEHLEKQTNMQGYIKNLILRDMQK